MAEDLYGVIVRSLKQNTQLKSFNNWTLWTVYRRQTTSWADGKRWCDTYRKQESHAVARKACDAACFCLHKM